MREPFIQSLLEQIDLVKLISSDYPLTESSRGHFLGWHTVHESKSKQSLHVYAEGSPQSWYCFNCGKGGTAIDYIMSKKEVSAAEAIGWLCETYRIQRPHWTPEQQAEWERRQHERQIVEAILMEAAAYYHQRLTPQQRAYFHQRGLTDETIDTFQLGYADGTLYHAFTIGELLKKDGTRKHNDKELLLSGLFVRFDDGTIKDAFEQRYLFPYWQRGKVVYMIGRLDPEIDPMKLPKWNQGKYKKLSTYDEKNRPYISQEVQNETFIGEDSIYEHAEGIITEGVVDCLLALQAGFSCISPATIGFRKADFPKLALLTKRWETVYIINDNEESGSGERGALATAQYLFEQGRHVRLVELPRPEGVSKIDLADFLNVEGSQREKRGAELRDLISSAPDFIEWKIREAQKVSGLQRAKAIEAIAEMLATLKETECEHYIEQMVSQKLISRRVLFNAIRQARIDKAKAAKAERMKEAEETLSEEALLKLQIEEIRKRKQKLFLTKRQVSRVIIDDMRESGRFYKTPTRGYYWFAHEEKFLYEIGQDVFPVYVNHRYGINPSEIEYEFLREDLITEAAVRGKETEVHQFAFYDKVLGVLYIDNNANQIYRLDGKSISLVDNGYNGVLFLKNPLHEPFTYRPNVAGVFYDTIIRPINFERGSGVSLNPKEQELLFWVWMASLFFESIQPTKPLQFFLGPKGSGKTTCQRMIGKWLCGKNFNVTSIAKDKEDDFVTAITNKNFIAIDNVDSQIPWLPDRLAKLGTGEEIQKRELYTTNTLRTYFPKCFVSLNAREPKFKRDDVVDRLLLFRVNRLEHFLSESKIIDTVLSARDDLWSEFLEDLNVIVAGLKTDTEEFMTNFRMADWASLGWRIMKMRGQGDDFLFLLNKMDRAQSDFLMEDNSIYECLEVWIGDRNNVGREVKVSELFEEFLAIAESESIGFSFKSARSMGKQLRQILSNLRNYFDITDRQVNRSWHYTFEPKRDE